MQLHFNTWLIYFYFYCICGWIFESTYVSIRTKKLTNRGFMKGPWLPLYGSGAVIVLFVTMPFEQYPVAVYFAGAIAATILEYITGVVMLKLFKVRYWDYRYQKIQFQGHICLTSTIAWGFLSLLMVYVVHKPVAAFIATWNPEFLSVFTFVVTICMAYDFANAFRDAMDLRALVIKAEELAKQLNAAFEEEKIELERKATEKKNEFETAVKEKKEQMEGSVKEKKEQLESSVKEKKEQFESSVKDRKEQFENSVKEKKEQFESSVNEKKEQLGQYTEEKRNRLEKTMEEYQEIYELNKLEKAHNTQNRIAALEEVKTQLRAKMEEKAKQLLLHNPGSSIKGFEEESKTMRIHLMERRKSKDD